MKYSIKIFSRQFALLSMLIPFSYAMAQVPANDDACNAIVLAAGTSCVPSTYTNVNATDSSEPDPGCASYNGADVWFKVKVPASGHLIFDSDTGSMLDGGMAVYSGNCASLTLLECNDDSSLSGPSPQRMPRINLCYLTPGDTLWIRFWEYQNASNGTFKICVYDGGSCPALPVNDEPCNAALLPVGNTCSFSISNNATALGSANVPPPGCANYFGGDVWFKVQVPVSGHLIFDSDTMQIEDGGMAIYSGTCSALTLIECNDDASTNGAMPLIENSSLTAGDTVWIRFWEYSNDERGSFKICVWDGVFTSIPNDQLNVSVKTFPNPFSEKTTLTIAGGQIENYGLKIFNVYGQEAHPEIVRNSSGFELQRNDMESGIYMYHIIMNGTNIHTGKLVVQ